MDNIVFLGELGYPSICVMADGTIMDTYTNHIYTGNQYVELCNHDGTPSKSFSRSKLYGYCFKAPWRYLDYSEYLDLAHLGYPFYMATVYGQIFGYHKMDFIAESLSDDGYCEVKLYDANRKLHYPKTHQIIAKAFIPNPLNKDTVNHKNGIKTDNTIWNLEWMWRWENMDHALKTGLKHSVMTDDMVHQACKMLSIGTPCSDVAKVLNVNVHNIKDILDGCHYRISMNYPDIPYFSYARHIPIMYK